MFEKLENYILEKHIRNILRKYYSQFNLKLEEVETASIYQLLKKIENVLELRVAKELVEPNLTIDKNTVYNMKELSSNTEVSFENTIKNTLKDKYVQFGLTKEDVQKMTVIELLEKIAERLQHSDKEFNYYASVVNNLEQKVDKLVIENKEMKQRMIDMKAENKSLNVELAKVREENYKLKLENSLYQQRTITQENTKSLSIAK
jgi:hypothetical protein